MPLVGEIIRLNIQLWDPNPGKFIRASLFDASGSPLINFPTVLMIHLSNGFYYNNQVPFPPGTPEVKVTYEVFDDALFSSVSRKYSNSADAFDLSTPDKILIVNESNIVGTMLGGSLVGLVVEPDPILVGQLLENNDDPVPGSSQDDGYVVGQYRNRNNRCC